MQVETRGRSDWYVVGVYWKYDYELVILS